MSFFYLYTSKIDNFKEKREKFIIIGDDLNTQHTSVKQADTNIRIHKIETAPLKILL